jgi:hypothetical protein
MKKPPFGAVFLWELALNGNQQAPGFFPAFLMYQYSSWNSDKQPE